MDIQMRGSIMSEGVVVIDVDVRRDLGRSPPAPDLVRRDHCRRRPPAPQYATFLRLHPPEVVRLFAE